MELSQASSDFRFSAAVVAFGECLSEPDVLSDYGFSQVAALAESALGRDPDSQRRAFVDLVRKAGEIR